MSGAAARTGKEFNKKKKVGKKRKEMGMLEIHTKTTEYRAVIVNRVRKDFL